jgi:hypothetical protein
MSSSQPKLYDRRFGWMRVDVRARALLSVIILPETRKPPCVVRHYSFRSFAFVRFYLL